MPSEKTDVPKKKLVQKREQIKGSLRRFQIFIEHFDRENDTFYEIEARLGRINELAAQFDDVQLEIEALTGVKDDERESFENAFFGTVANARRLESAYFVKYIMSHQNLSVTFSSLAYHSYQLFSFKGAV